MILHPTTLHLVRVLAGARNDEGSTMARRQLFPEPLADPSQKQSPSMVQTGAVESELPSNARQQVVPLLFQQGARTTNLDLHAQDLVEGVAEGATTASIYPWPELQSAASASLSVVQSPAQYLSRMERSYRIPQATTTKNSFDGATKTSMRNTPVYNRRITPKKRTTANVLARATSQPLNSRLTPNSNSAIRTWAFAFAACVALVSILLVYIVV